MQIQNAIQHFQGGVKIDTDARTNLKGLYAAGECAGGQHGANRPGGNSLLDTQVFGKIAGRNAAIEARQITLSQINPDEDPFSYGTIPSSKARKMITDTVSESAFLVRQEQEITKALSTIESIENQGICIDENGLTHFLETRNMLILARVILTSILLRDESRGPQGSGHSNRSQWQQ